MPARQKLWYQSETAKMAAGGTGFISALLFVFWPVRAFPGSTRWFALGLWIVILLLSGIVALLAFAKADDESKQAIGRQTDSAVSRVDLDIDAARFRKKIKECLLDGRISGYFDRGLVSEEDVIEPLVNGAAFRQAQKGELYSELINCRIRVRCLDGLNSFVISRGEVNFGSVAALAGILFTFAFAMADVGEARPLALGITLVALLFSGLSGVLFARAKVGDQYEREKLILAAATMLISISSIVVPYFTVNSRWTPTVLFPMWVTWLAVSYLLSGDERIEQCIDLLIYVGRTATLFFLERRSSWLQDEWLDGCVEDIIMPQAVLAINTVLGEDKDRLLVEQDSEGLRRLQDPSLTVPTGSERRIESVLSQMDGGSIALSGPRGAGKSTLLRKFTEITRTDVTAGRHISVYLPAPAEYVPKDFLSELFQRICEAYLVFTGQPLPEAIRGERAKPSLRRAAVRGFGIVRFTLRISIMIGLVVLAILPLIRAGIHYIPSSISSVDDWYSHDKQYVYINVYKFRDRWIAARLVMVFVALYCLPKGVRLWRVYIRPSKEPELSKKAREYLVRLQVDKTVTWGAGLTVPIVRSMGLSLNKGTSAAYVPWTLPELVGHMRRFMNNIADEFSESKHAVIVGIDEIDRIGSLEQAERFLSEIKAIFGVERCFFLVSVAEDVGSVFAQRTTAGRSILDNSFDDIIAVEPLNIAETRELLLKRVPGFTHSFVYLVHSLSGGLPRELIRVTRRLVDVNQELILRDSHSRIENLAFALASEQLIDAIRATRNQMSRLRLHSRWTEFFEELRSAGISLQHASPFSICDSYMIFKRLSEISVPDAFVGQAVVSEDEVSAGRIVRDFAAFSYFCMTVIDAFDKNFFDFQRVQEMTASGTAGSYEELSAARAEIGFSSENSRAMIEKFRSSLLSVPKRVVSSNPGDRGSSRNKSVKRIRYAWAERSKPAEG